MESFLRNASGIASAPVGSDGSSQAIVLITDGQGNLGPDLLDMAKLAAQHRVRIYTVGIGTVDGETIGFEGWSMRVRLDEDGIPFLNMVYDGLEQSTALPVQIYLWQGNELRNFFEARTSATARS
mgnify:CR=1 FL=1